MAKQTDSGSRAGRAENDLLMQKRAATAAGIGLATQFVLAIVAYVLMARGRAVPLDSVFTFAAAGLIAWIAVMVAVNFRRAKALEDLELEAAQRSGEAGRTIFASEADARPAARRVERVHRFVLPAAAILLGLYLTWHGFWKFRMVVSLAGIDHAISNARILAGMFAGLAFVGFVVGRYLLGMSSNPAWRILRGGATYTIGTVVLFALMAASAGARGLGAPGVNSVMQYIVPLFMLLVGTEMLLNIVLDLYRPKTAGEISRPAFDSRLLSLVASPGGIVRSLNEAVNYQFGFEITQSWFWRLLSRSFAWLVLFGISILVVLSSMVIVEPHEMALFTRFGKLDPEPRGPGLHLKAPWPLTMVDKYRVTRVEEMVVGSHDQIQIGRAILWTNLHAHGEELLIVAPTNRDDLELLEADLVRPQPVQRPSGGAGMLRSNLMSGPEELDAEAIMSAPTVGLAAADVYIQWKIDPDQLVRFATASAEPAQRLRHIANAATARELLKYDIDSAIGSARPEIARNIEQRIRQRVEQEQLGIQVLWVGLASVHPPQAVAEDFNLGAAAVQQGARALQQGLREQTQILTAAAGSVGAAQRIVREFDRLEALRRQFAQGEATLEQVEAQQAELERLVQRAGGDAARRLLDARRLRWDTENAALSESVLQPGELASYREAPDYYRVRRYLQVLRETMPERKKIVMMTGDENPYIVMDLKQMIDALSGITVPQRVEPGRLDD